MIFDQIMPLNPDRIEQINRLIRLWALYGWVPTMITGWGPDDEIEIGCNGGKHRMSGRWAMSEADWLELLKSPNVLTYNGSSLPDPL
jgi:hypothetical protein